MKKNTIYGKRDGEEHSLVKPESWLQLILGMAARHRPLGHTAGYMPPEEYPSG